jgi:hypothetical protein
VARRVGGGPRPTTHRVCATRRSSAFQSRNAVSAPASPQSAHTPDARSITSRRHACHASGSPRRRTRSGDGGGAVGRGAVPRPRTVRPRAVLGVVMMARTSLRRWSRSVQGGSGGPPGSVRPGGGGRAPSSSPPLAVGPVEGCPPVEERFNDNDEWIRPRRRRPSEKTATRATGSFRASWRHYTESAVVWFCLIHLTQLGHEIRWCRRPRS